MAGPPVAVNAPVSILLGGAAEEEAGSEDDLVAEDEDDLVAEDDDVVDGPDDPEGPMGAEQPESALDGALREGRSC